MCFILISLLILMEAFKDYFFIGFSSSFQEAIFWRCNNVTTYLFDGLKNVQNCVRKQILGQMK